MLIIATCEICRVWANHETMKLFENKLYCNDCYKKMEEESE